MQTQRMKGLLDRGRLATAVTVGALALLAFAPAASAAPSTVSVGAVSNAVRSLKISAAGDTVAHQIAVTRQVTATTDDIIVTDGAGIVASGACVQLSPTAISCRRDLGGPLNAFLSEVDVSGSEAADLIDYSGFSDLDVFGLAGGNGGDDTLIGGDSNEDLFGGPGRDLIDGRGGLDDLFGQGGKDRVIGGAGGDSLVGGSGIDRLLARDGERDRRISCGGGSNERERAVVDRSDPDAKSC